MIKSVIVKIKGDCEQGFSAELRSGKKGEASTKVIEGTLPPSPELPQKYQNFQSAYRQHGGMGSSTRTLTAKKIQVTNVSINDFVEEVKSSINDLLNSAHPQYRRFRDKLVGELQGEGKISLVIQTDDLTLWRLPWQLWDVLEDNKVEVSICPCEYEKAETVPITKPKNRVRILVIIGDSRGINTKKDLKLLEEELPSAEIQPLIHPTKEQLSSKLWEQEWDILFFAGHSSSEDENFQGFFKINETESLTIKELKDALNNAIKYGLKLAIFNSCDGLGLARELASLQIPATVVMREKVADEVAQKFLEYFLKAFAEKEKSLLDAVREARERLREIEEKNGYVCASWLPAICHNPAELMPSWRSLLGEFLEGEDGDEMPEKGADSNKAKVGWEVPKNVIVSPWKWIVESKLRLGILGLVGGISFLVLRPLGAGFLNEKATERINDGDLASARVYLDWALKLAPKHPGAVNNKGYIDERLQEDEDAKEKFRVSKKQLNPGGCNNEAFMDIKEGNYKKAADLLVECLTLVKSDVGRHYMLKNLGWALLEQNEYDEAEEHLRSAIKLMPKRGAANCLLAQVLDAKGDRENAVTEWKACLKYVPDKFPEEIEWKRQARKYLSAKEK